DGADRSVRFSTGKKRSGIREVVRQGPPAESPSDILKVLSRFEANRAAGRNANFLAGPWVTADSTLAGFHLEHAKAAQLDPFAALHRQTHRVEHGIHGHLGF